MNAETLNPAQLILAGCATVENRRTIPKKPFTFAYDCIFTCADPEHDEGLACFRTYVGRDTNQKQDGLYDISAKFISYRPERNPDRSSFEDDKIHLLGQIICMRKITVHNDDDLAACEEHARIHGSGVVTATDRDRLSFTIHGVQYVSVADRPQDVVVRCRMDMNPKWTQPAQRLPAPPSVVAFEGVLQGFEPYTSPYTAIQLPCAIVALEDITYIRKGGPSADPPSVKDSLRKKFRNRARKFKDSTPKNEASTSQKTLGKRKADESDDEVEDSVQPEDETT